MSSLGSAAAASNTATAPRLAEALRLAVLGHPVFPCGADKAPLTRTGFKDATTDPDAIRDWWGRWPAANPAVATGGLLVVDLDPGSPWIGDRDWDGALLTACGAISLTPRGGCHYWFRRPEGVSWRCSAGLIAPKTDVRTDGGYVLTPPGRTADGEYKWSTVYGPLSVPADELPTPPDWLAELLDRPERRAVKAGGGASAGEAIADGMRNSRLTSIAGAMRRQGMTFEEMRAALLVVNENRCDPPLEESDVEKIARSVSRYPPSPDPPVTIQGGAAERAAWEVVRDHFAARYRPSHRDGDALYSTVERREVRRQEACAALPPDLIGPLSAAPDAPKFKGGGADVQKLPGFFRKWAGTGWAALLAELPDEDAADLGVLGDAAETFRRLVRDAMLAGVPDDPTPDVSGDPTPPGENLTTDGTANDTPEWWSIIGGDVSDAMPSSLWH